MTVEAQLFIKKDGRAYVGQPPRQDEDSLHVLLMSLQGKYTEYNAGAKLGFGDFGQRHRCGWNVFVGEYDTVDSDILWLHGKNGIKLTMLNGWDALEWKVGEDLTPSLTISDNVCADRITISSADSHKEDVSMIKEPLGKLRALRGISYLYHPVKNRKFEEPCDTCKDLSKKEMKDINRIRKTMATHNEGRIRYGFFADEVAKVFPELVEEDESQNQYVNYIEIIPVIVNALNEMADYMGLFPKMSGLSDNSGERAYATVRNMSLTVADSARLFQNTPNPFTDNTDIEYYIPTDATSAAIYVFNLVGTLLQTYPITEFGDGYVTVSGFSLEAGMYVYALVVDGQIIDSKRMILTR